LLIEREGRLRALQGGGDKVGDKVGDKEGDNPGDGFLFRIRINDFVG
jgi:hypothetical protein